MVYCINPRCHQRQNPDEAENCLACGTPLLINNRIRLIEPLRSLDEDPFSYFEIFEVDDAGTKWNPVRERRVMKMLKWYHPKLVEMIRREATILSLIQHPSIPKASIIDDYFTFSLLDDALELYCLVMQKFEGQNLKQWVKLYGRIPQSLAIKWLKQIVKILDVVHHNGFFHRDIKPENIIIQPNGELALIDFNGARRITNTYLAKVSSSGGTKTSIGSGYEITDVKTVNYSPLEQINGQAVPQSDFYALGKTFVYLITGISLSELKTDPNTGRLIWRKKASQIEPPLANFLDELMAPFPGQRPQNTQIILQRLEQIPFQTKLSRVTNSNLFRASAAALSFLLIIGSYRASLPLIANHFLRQGIEAEQENRYEDAQKNFQLATKINSTTADSISSFYFEQASRNQERPSVAKKYYELAIKYNPQDIGAYNNLALVCQQLQDSKCVTDNYKEVFERQPKTWEARYGLGSYYDDLGKYDLAKQQYKLAIESNSDLAIDAMTNLARLLNKSGEYEQAIALSQTALNKTENPGSQAASYKNIGWAKLEQGRYEEAKGYLQKATDLDSQRVDAYCLLAKAQEATGEIEAAKISWEVCLIAKSTLPEVQDWRLQVLQRFLGN